MAVYDEPTTIELEEAQLDLKLKDMYLRVPRIATLDVESNERMNMC